MGVPVTCSPPPALFRQLRKRNVGWVEVGFEEDEEVDLEPETEAAEANTLRQDPSTP